MHDVKHGIRLLAHRPGFAAALRAPRSE